MFQHPATGVKEVMSSFPATSQRHMSQHTWSPPPQIWYARNSPIQQSTRSPHNNSRPSLNGYRGSPQRWSPNGWEPVSNYQRTWGPNPQSPQFSPHYRHSPEHRSMYSSMKDGKSQVHLKHKRGNPKDISNYYKPSMLEDPWAELQTKTCEEKSHPPKSTIEH